MSAEEISIAVQALANPEKAAFLSRFFKTGKGEYGAGDVFAGLTVPQCRKIARDFRDLKMNEIKLLLTSAIHEERLIALLLLVSKYQKATGPDKNMIAQFYLQSLAYVNNWDLVDSSAQYILGDWLLKRNRKILYKLARSKDLWKRRVAIISTFAFINAGDFEDTFAIASMLMNDKHDLIHKATGWMLREVGKRVSMDQLRRFLQQHAAQMPRTAFRYAIERMPEAERKNWLNAGK